MPKPKTKCDIKTHFDCDGTGQMCNNCGESEAACSCGEPALTKCEGCEGATRICVAHESPAGNPTVCDAAS